MRRRVASRSGHPALIPAPSHTSALVDALRRAAQSLLLVETDAEAGIATGSLYRHFSRKGELASEVFARASQRERPALQRHTGYLGPRRRLLVVDNEETDRRLLADRLAPLGFSLLQAESGEAALALLATTAVDAVFLDLAMPGIDGWENIRRVRALLPRPPRIAIVSANAFDRGLDNGLGLPPEDFIVKPVRHTELLDWLERKLALEWVDALSAPGPAAPGRRR